MKADTPSHRLDILSRRAKHAGRSNQAPLEDETGERNADQRCKLVTQAGGADPDATSECVDRPRRVQFGFYNPNDLENTHVGRTAR